MADPETGLWEGLNFKEVPQFLKSIQILPAYGLTSNKDQTTINKSCFVFLLYRGIGLFCAIFGRFGGGGGMAAFCPVRSAFEGYDSPPPVNTYVCNVYARDVKISPKAKPKPRPESHQIGWPQHRAQSASFKHRTKPGGQYIIHWWSFLPSPA